MVNKRKLGATGLMVTEMGFGALEIGRDWAADINADPSHPSEEEAARVLNGILDRGINFIDTAPAYWSSEEFIGRAISHRRGEYILATKVGEQCDRSGSVYDYSAEATERFVNQSLARLRTDCIDLIQIHSASMEVLERGETLGALQRAREQGKVRHIGMTGGVKECVRALEIGGYETVQFPYSLLHREAEESMLGLVGEKQAGAIIMRGLAGGKLTEKFARIPDEALRDEVAKYDALARAHDVPGGLATLAIQFILARPEVSSIIVGTRRLDAVEANLQAACADLPGKALSDLLGTGGPNPKTIW